MFSCAKMSGIKASFLSGLVIVQLIVPLSVRAENTISSSEIKGLLDSGNKLVEKNNHRSAEKLSRQAYRLSKELSEKDILRAKTADLLGDVQEKQGRLGAAEQYYQEALECREKIYGEASPLAVPSILSLASVKSKNGDYGRAKDLLERALLSRQSVQSENDRLKADIAQELGHVYSVYGDTKNAESCFQSALAYHQDQSNYSRMINAWNGLSSTYISHGQFQKADGIATGAVHYALKHLPNDKRIASESLLVLAKVRMLNGTSADVQALLDKAAENARKSDGVHSRLYGECLSGYGLLRLKEKNYCESEKFFSQAIDIFAITLSCSHKSLENALFGRAVSRQILGRHAQARADFDRAMGILKSSLGSDHSQVKQYQSLFYRYASGEEGSREYWLSRFAKVDNLANQGIDPFGSLLSKVLPEPSSINTSAAHTADLMFKAFGIVFIFIGLLALALLAPGFLAGMLPMLDIALLKPQQTKVLKKKKTENDSSIEQNSDTTSRTGLSVDNSGYKPLSDRFGLGGAGCVADSSAAGRINRGSRTTVTDIKVGAVEVEVWKNHLRQLEIETNAKDKS